MKILYDYITQRVNERNKNFIMLFVGPTGSGKSYAALRMAEILDPTFDIKRVAFRAKDFMDKINKLISESEQGKKIRGKVLLWDEAGVENNAREFMTISNRVINYFFQTSRHLNLIVLMTVPMLSFIDSSTRKLIHSVAEMTGINTGEKTSMCKVKFMQANAISNKEYLKYLRYRMNGGSYKVQRITLKLPSLKLRRDYEGFKKEFTTKLNREIMAKLEKNEIKNNSPRFIKLLTEKQLEAAEALQKMDMKNAAKELDVNMSDMYRLKKTIETKGYEVRPVYHDKKVIRYEIGGLLSNSTNPITATPS